MKQLISLVFLLTSCTYSVVMNHTEGQASDLVDETQGASPQIEAEIPMVGK